MLKKKEKVEKEKEQNKEIENKIGIKEKIKRFLKNKKAVAMLMEYIITIECFTMLFLLIAPEEVKAATSTADENGITWAYTLSNGQATNVYYESGTLGETVTIPSTISDGTNEYPVVSLYNNGGSYRNIFTKTNSGSNTTVKKVIIPSSVTSIGVSAFRHCSSLTSVEIPSSVTSIGERAFYGCRSLTSVEIPSSVTSIGSYAFSSCSSLTNVVILGGSIGSYAFSSCTALTSVEIAEGVTSIESYAFSSCTALTSVEIAEGVTSIESYAFSSCTALTSVEIAEGVTSIESYAFSSCTALTSVEIPSSVTSIGSYAFSSCSSLRNITVDENNANYSSENNIIYNKDKTTLILCAARRQGEVIIPEGVTSIGNYAFSSCSSLTSVVIPEGVTSIGERAFYNCESLTSVEIPSSVTSIGSYAFQNCSSLTSVVIQEGVTSIGNYAFSRCSSLTSVEIPSSVTSIGSYAFQNCSSLTSVVIGEGVTSTGEYTFENCRSLTSVVIQEGVTSIGSYAFQNCSSLISVNIPNSVTSIGSYAFQNCSSLISVNIPNSVTSIGIYAFYNCSSLTSVNIPNSVTSIGSSAFYNCSSLTSVNIPNSVTRIGIYAFKGCSSLTSVEIPGSVTSIGNYAFQSCSSLTSVVIGEGVTSTGEYTFENCSSLTSVEIPGSVTSIGWYAFCGCRSLTSVNIPSSVTYIGSRAFYECSSLKSVNIQEGVTDIGSYAFYRCSSLSSVEIPSSVTNIGSYAFYGCRSLTDIYIDNLQCNITFERFWNLDTYAYVHYSDCNHSITKTVAEAGLQIEEIGNNLENGTISCGATYQFKVLNEQGNVVTNRKVKLTSQGEFTNSAEVTKEILPNEEGIYTIENINRNKTITVGIANGTKLQYTDENGITWNYTYQDLQATNVYYESGTLPEIVEIPNALDGYPVVSVYNTSGSSRNIFAKSTGATNTTIKEIILPDTLKRIETSAFYNCKALERVNIPEGVTYIAGGGYGAFEQCDSLISVEIPNSVTQIDSYAFCGCDKLTDIYIDNIQSNITFASNWKSGTNAYVHYNGCKHTVTISNDDTREKVEFEEITHNLENGKIACGESYSFKLVNEEGEVVTDKEVRIKSQGQFTNNSDVTETITSNEEGIYTIENIERNKKIIIGMENGETAQVTDENGITWEYKYEDGKARALKYISGEIPETLEVPAVIDGLVVTTMGDYPNYGEQRENIKNVILPDSIINIGQNAFENCTTLETIVLPEGLQLISNLAFKGCSNLEQVELPDDLLAIGNEAFSGCTSLRMNLNFKNGIRVIGKESFKNCTSLKGKLTLPESTIQVGTGAFKDCTEITKVEILSYTGEKEIDQAQVNLISNPWEGNVWINESGTAYSLNYYSNMTGIYENTVTNNIKDENGNNVKDEFGNNMTESFTLTKRDIYIGLEAFSGCSSLTEIRLPAGTNKVAYSTIDGCDNLTDLYIATKKSDMLEEVNTNGEVKVHYLDCSHTVEVMPIEGTSIEVVSGETEEGLAACQGEYKFKVNIEEGSTLKGVVVKVGNKGEEKEAIKADENGIYTIENVTKDKEISIEEGRIVEVRYEDKEGNQIAKSSILVGQEGENYKAERKEIANYRVYGEEPENKEGTFTKEEIVVTYQYEKIPSGTITIKYQDKEGNDIIDPETKQGYVGDEYEFARKNIRGYKAYGVTPEKAKGTYTEEDIEIIFVYEEIKEEETVIKYIDKDGNYIARDKTIQEGEEARTEAKEIDGYESVDKTEEGKEITYTYEKADKTGQANKWTTEKTLMAIAGVIAILIVMFIIIAKREKEVEVNGKKYRTIEEAIEAIKENKQEEKVEIKVLKDIERDEKIEELDDETIKIDYNGYEIKIKE